MFLELRTSMCQEGFSNFSVLLGENQLDCVLSTGPHWRDGCETPVCSSELCD